ncbi:MAG: hypothetical protein PHX38_00775 [Sulfuricella sp.]|nr:hypothetical protein [Sulfuricella sp.]
MFPLFPFVAGLVAGILATRSLRGGKVRGGLESIQEKLRDATVSGLGSVASASAAMKQRLEPEAKAANAEPAVAAPAAKKPARGRPPAAATRKKAASVKQPPEVKAPVQEAASAVAPAAKKPRAKSPAAATRKKKAASPDNTPGGLA